MKSRFITTVSTNKRLWALLVIFSALFLVMKMVPASSIAQAPQERVLENAIPKHVPIKVKIKKEKEESFKDLKNENWARDFELEVTNTGDKPIYELGLFLITDIKAAAGFRIVAPVYYGRTELGDIRTLATPDDIPIKPGESCILKIHPGQLEGWEIVKRKENWPVPKRIKVDFQSLSFGDGTGFAGTGGTALPRKLPLQSNLRKCLPQQNKSGTNPLLWPAAARDRQLRQSSSANLPASFLPVNFLSSEPLNANPLESKLEPDCCGDGCTSQIPHNEHPCVNCPDQQRPILTYCSDPQGSCYSSTYDYIVCYTGGQPYLCQTIHITSCGEEPPACESGWPVGSSCIIDDDCYCNLWCNTQFYPGTCEWPSCPILIDVNGDGFLMTDAAHGVAFDFKGTGTVLSLRGCFS
jgi:hypothetical protein